MPDLCQVHPALQGSSSVGLPPMHVLWNESAMRLHGLYFITNLQSSLKILLFLHLHWLVLRTFMLPIIGHCNIAFSIEAVILAKLTVPVHTSHVCLGCQNGIPHLPQTCLWFLTKLHNCMRN